MALDRVIPNRAYRIDIDEGYLDLSPAYDVVHRFSWLGFHLLKYWHPENGGICDMPINTAGVEYLLQSCGIHVLDRDTITEREHEIYVAYEAEALEEALLGDEGTQ